MAERGWWGGLFDETAKLPQGIRQLVVDAVTRQPRTDSTQPVVTPGPGGLLDLTPVPGFTEAYKASDDVGKGGYEGGKAVGTYLSGLLGIIPAVGAVRKAGPIRAYHGSPHSFDKFDLNKIGTGEGAQAYGHGLYFAGNEDVAKSYKRAGPAASREMDVINGELSRIAREMDQYHGGQYGKYTDPKGYELKAQYDALMQKKMDLGHMYEVGIHADPAKMLDWDKPLSQQHPDIQRIAKESYTPDAAARDLPGGTIYRGMLGTQDHPSMASDFFKEAGIPGIKYLDQGSRNKLELLPKNPITDNAREMLAATNNDGAAAIARLRQMSKDFGSQERAEIEKVIRQSTQQGTSNYVVFDPSLIEIMRKYGIPIGASGAAAAAVPGLLNQERQY